MKIFENNYKDNHNPKISYKLAVKKNISSHELSKIYLVFIKFNVIFTEGFFWNCYIKLVKLFDETFSKKFFYSVNFYACYFSLNKFTSNQEYFLPHTVSSQRTIFGNILSYEPWKYFGLIRFSFDIDYKSEIRRNKYIWNTKKALTSDGENVS